MARAVDARDEEGPERTCVVTRAKGSPDDMLRFVVAPDGKVTPDIARRLPGRGVWVSASVATLRKAISAKAFPRAFRGKAEVAPTLADEVGALLETDALRWLSLANKAGLIVTGFAKVEAAIGKAAVAALIHASDAGADGVEKLDRAARRRPGGDGIAPPTIGIFDSTQLGLALGRPHVIHAALMAGPAADVFMARCRRLVHFRGAPSGEPAAADGTISRDGTPASGAVSGGRQTNGQQTNGLGPGILNE